jgi:hypothetical protein
MGSTFMQPRQIEDRLKDLGLRMDAETAVKAFKRLKVRKSAYSLWNKGQTGISLMAKGTASKFKVAYDNGQLGFVDDGEKADAIKSQFQEDRQLRDREDAQLLKEHRDTLMPVLPDLSHDKEDLIQHNEDLREPLRLWVKCLDQETIQSWIEMVDVLLLSPQALLQLSKNWLAGITFGQEEDYNLQSLLPAPSLVTRSTHFYKLRQHLIDDVIWEKWKHASEEYARLIVLVWRHTHLIIRLSAGYLSGCLAAQHHDSSLDSSRIDMLKPLVADPLYRDAFSEVLKPVVHLIGAEAARCVLQQPEFGDQIEFFLLNLFTLQQEDLLQRVLLSKSWPRPMGHRLRQLVESYWQEGQDENVKAILDREGLQQTVLQWKRWNVAREAILLHLKSMLDQNPFPGTCSQCQRA